MAIQQKIRIGKVKEVGSPSARVLRFIASDQNPDRDGDIIDVAGWDVTQFNSNPVVLWAHNSSEPPVGKAVKVQKDIRNNQLLIDVQFMSPAEINPGGDPSEHAKFAESIYQMYKSGYLSAVSVGFMPIDFERRTDGDQANLPDYQRGLHIKSASLLELSCVPVPANADALVMARSVKGIDTSVIDIIEKEIKMNKSAIPFKHYPLAPDDTEWDAGKVIADSDVDDLKIECAWYDSSKKPDDLTKGDFKLPHHLGADDGYKTVRQGVIAAVGALMGARGGVKIPDADIAGVEKHLKAHYVEFKLDWPEDKEAFIEMEKSMNENEMNKSGARLSKETMAALDELEGCHKEVESCMKALDSACKALKSAHVKACEKLESLRKGPEPVEPEEPGKPDEEHDNKPGDKPGNKPDDGTDNKSATIHIIA